MKIRQKPAWQVAIDLGWPLKQGVRYSTKALVGQFTEVDDDGIVHDRSELINSRRSSWSS